MRGEKKCPIHSIMDVQDYPNNNMPSLYELLFGRKLKTMLPTAKGVALQSCHPEKETHLQKNEQNQTKQKQNYDRHSSQQKEILDIMVPIYAGDTRCDIWYSIDLNQLWNQERT